MPNLNSSTSDILKRVQITLTMAERGLETLIKGPTGRKMAGFWNLVVFGRAVTNVLQNLSSVEPDFYEWYTKYQEEMKTDPLMKYFYELRTKILKRGLSEVSIRIDIRKINIPEDLDRFGPPPPNAKGFFIGDSFGGSGWEVQLANGSIEKYYVELPSDIGSVSMHFPDPPKYHLGQDLKNDSIETLSRIYIDYLRRLVECAKQNFKTKY